MKFLNKACKALVFCTTTLMATHALAIQPVERIYAPFDLGDYVLKPDESQPFMNFMRWVVTIKCFVRDTENDEPANISIKLLRKKGTLNDIELSAGDDPLLFTVEPNETFVVTAQPNAKVRLTNTGTQDITAHCDAISEFQF